MVALNSIDSSFRLLANIILQLHQKGGFPYTDFISEEHVADNVQFLTEISLNKLGSLIRIDYCRAYLKSI